MTLEELRYELLKLDIEDIKVICYKDGKDLILPAEVAGYFKPDTAGRLRTIIDTSGQVTEASASAINTRISNVRYGGMPPSIGAANALVASDAQRDKANHRILDDGGATLSGGSLANHPLLGSTAGYYGIVIITGIYSDTTFTVTLDFEDEDDTDCLGVPASFNIALTANVVTAIDPPIVLWGAADAKGIEVDLSGGGGVEVLKFLGETSLET